MLDLTGIMFSSLVMVLVVIKAVQLDRMTPWFEVPGSLLTKAPVQGTAPARPSQNFPSWRDRINQTKDRRR